MRMPDPHPSGSRTKSWVQSNGGKAPGSGGSVCRVVASFPTVTGFRHRTPLARPHAGEEGEAVVQALAVGVLVQAQCGNVDEGDVGLMKRCGGGVGDAQTGSPGKPRIHLRTDRQCSSAMAAASAPETANPG